MRIAVLALAASIAASPARAQAPGTPRKWAHESTDLPVDPRIHFGALPSGLRYAWVHQPLQEDKTVHLRLHVDVGSLVEQDNEQGIAHFTEHMAFNGTKKFKAGTLIDWFQSHGVQFGHDVNASTDETATSYEMDLPDAEAERLGRAFEWLRDVCDGLLFEEKEVQAEKGVIDAEERERAGAGLRLYQKMQTGLIDGTLPPKRLPIGKKSARDKFNSALCKAFYKKWYRPELMTLIVVGNLPDVDVEQKVKDVFGSLPVAKDPVPAKPPLGTPKIAAKQFCAYDSESKDCSIFAAKVKPYVLEPDTVASRQHAMVRGAALGLASQHLAAIARKPGSPIDGASFGDWSFEELLEGPTLVVNCAPAKWKEALALAAAELDRTLASGFTREEFQKTYQDLSAYCAVEPQADKLPMGAYLGELLAAADGGHVPVDEIAVRRLMKPMLKDLTAESLQKELAAAWKEGELYLFCSGGLDLGKDAAMQLQAAWAARADPVAAALAATAPAVTEKGGAGAPGKPTDGKPAPTAGEPGDSESDEAVEWAYKARGATGHIVKNEQNAELQLVRLDFENGVKAVLHPTVQQNQGAALYVRVGDGFLALEPSEADVGWVANQVFLRSGLAEHSLEQLQKVLRGQQLSFGFNVDFDACTFSGSAGPEGFQRLCEVICAYIKDPGWRPEPFQEFNANLGRLYESMEQGFSGPLSEFELELHGKDPRFGTPDRKLVESFLLDTLKEFLQPQLDDGSIELAVVSGMDPNTLANVVSRTFGILPRRGEAAANPARADRLQSPPVKAGLKMRREIETQEKKGHVSIVWPTGDGIDPKRRHELELLAAALDNRVRIEIREKKGAAYSPSARPDVSTLLPGVGCIRIDVECDPAKVDEVTNACLTIGDALAKNGLKPDEFAQVRTLALTQMDQAMAQDGWWLVNLSKACTHPESLNSVRDAKKILESVTIDAVNALVKTCLPRANASTAIIVPKAAKPPKKK